MNNTPDVDLADSTISAQLASQAPIKSDPLFLYVSLHSPVWRICLRYPNTRLHACICCAVGCCRCLLNYFTTYDIVGSVDDARYSNAPTFWRYAFCIVLSLHSPIIFCSFRSNSIGVFLMLVLFIRNLFSMVSMYLRWWGTTVSAVHSISMPRNVSAVPKSVIANFFLSFTKNSATS